MKTIDRIITTGIICCLKSVCLGNESDYKCIDQLPSETLICYYYQIKTIGNMFDLERVGNVERAIKPLWKLSNTGHTVLENMKYNDVPAIYPWNKNPECLPSSSWSRVISLMSQQLNLCFDGLGEAEAKTITTAIDNLKYLDWCFDCTPIPEQYMPVKEAIAKKNLCTNLWRMHANPFHGYDDA